MESSKDMISAKIVPFNKTYSPLIKEIRTQVFVYEQKVDADLDFDGQDNDAIHVLIFYQKKPIGTARMLDDGHIGRVAVLKSHRKKGAGSLALTTLIEEAKRRKIHRVYLGSQISAVGFYEKLGFITHGEEFMEAGIRHINMALSLD